ncbi:MAG: hypothetical protein VKK97_10280 [Synechococcaceae cyanobacterium]|nr:hypothetical protein [Synechococcaceae cyanobacterium]
MAAPQSLLQAAAIRLAARLSSSLADSAASLAVLAQDAPALLRQELTLFWDEVEREAERLERQPWSREAEPPDDAAADPQEQIDALRARVAELCRRLEARPREPG